jgi:hypothetical protein
VRGSNRQYQLHGGKVAFPYLLPYAASKFAIAGWSQGLRAELAGKGIRVTTIFPGVMRTGSHIQARFTGNQVQEYRWFAAASLPGTATNAAARKIVRSLATGSAEISIGLQAIVAARLSNVAPELQRPYFRTRLPHCPTHSARGIQPFGKAISPSSAQRFAARFHRWSNGSGPGLIQRYNQEPTASTASV